VAPGARSCTNRDDNHAEKPISEPIASLATGLLKFPDDWPGMFIRGDEALGYAATLPAATVIVVHSEV
jgi:hypothetical protein